ncbi:hypothetical protein E2C01_081858 [Portunus trituberculatus]|uniref:Uncharacterized protein n=1 Tax=Portunus trituberculatus TaxID=210409 RepID=A0A5B7IQV9_PORTR|nr:hypothetical protein [Portunus trituberculatus]
MRTKQRVFQSLSVKAKREHKLTISDGNNSEDYRGYRPHTDTDGCLTVEIGIDAVRRWCRQAGTRREDRGSETGWTREMGARRQGERDAKAGRSRERRAGYMELDEMRRVCKVARNVMDDVADAVDVKDRTQ